jgi:hypothetical protein
MIELNTNGILIILGSLATIVVPLFRESRNRRWQKEDTAGVAAALKKETENVAKELSAATLESGNAVVCKLDKTMHELHNYTHENIHRLRGTLTPLFNVMEEIARQGIESKESRDAVLLKLAEVKQAALSAYSEANDVNKKLQQIGVKMADDQPLSTAEVKLAADTKIKP